ncbi:hypothetical protein DXG01_005685 [Tephrocybe rancida]|nr:hypothetical protein DXG01_005685 [Tephrocybe rancida]
MEGVEGHLRRRLSNRLGRKGTTPGAQEGLSRQMKFLEDMTQCKGSTQVHVEIECCILLRLSAEIAATTNNDEPLPEFFEGIDNVSRFEVAGLSPISVEDLHRILHNMLEVDWEIMR